MDVLRIENLSKKYDATLALNRASWQLAPGRLTGFLGPNGAGKTTTIRILMGFLKPTSGVACVFGLDSWMQSAAIHRRVGYLAGDAQLYRSMTGQQIVEFVAGARGMTTTTEASRLANVFELDLRVRVRECSKGMRQKIGLIAAMMHHPELLILDEPTASLDPLMQQALYTELRSATEAGRTVLFSSHSLAEVSALCQDVVILRAGEVVASTSIDALRTQAGQSVRLRLSSSTADVPPPPDGFTIDRRENSTLEGRWQGPPAVLMAWLSRLPLAEVVIQPPDLEDVFLAFYGQHERESA